MIEMFGTFEVIGAIFIALLIIFFIVKIVDIK